MGANHGLSDPIAVPHSNERNGCLKTELHASSISLKPLCRTSVARATNRHCPLGVDRIGTKATAVRGSGTREFVTAPHACVEAGQSTWGSKTMRDVRDTTSAIDTTTASKALETYRDLDEPRNERLIRSQIKELFGRRSFARDGGEGGQPFCDV